MNSVEDNWEAGTTKFFPIQESIRDLATNAGYQFAVIEVLVREFENGRMAAIILQKLRDATSGSTGALTGGLIQLRTH